MAGSILTASRAAMTVASLSSFTGGPAAAGATTTPASNNEFRATERELRRQLISQSRPICVDGPDQ